MTNFKEALQHVKGFAFDVDGVLSSPKVYVSPDGELIRTMNTKDGYAIQYAVKRGYPVAIITGARSELVGIRFRNLGLRDIYLGSSNKVNDFEDYISRYGFGAEEILYMGDDLPDFYVMQKAGIACAPSDAVEEIKAISDYISHFGGGEGCVRDVIEQVLRLHGRWMDGEAFVW
ncbi:MAG: HAD-IIIA family hydrolase [Bacteroidales bacterium]|nr:HAD-IIIA family hydrolase [Bacteroidales bacterium]MBN2697782.1 HAD-IIIA family hydrolase [Bacteroidales bacterium]